MESNTSNAVFIGVSTFIFVAAISTTLILLSIVENIAKVSLEKIEDVDKTVLQVSDEVNSNIVTGHEVLTYYANYVVPQNEEFVFKQCSDSTFKSCTDLTDTFFRDKLDKNFIKYTSTIKNKNGEEVPLIRFVFCNSDEKQCADIEFNTTK